MSGFLIHYTTVVYLLHDNTGFRTFADSEYLESVT